MSLRLKPHRPRFDRQRGKLRTRITVAAALAVAVGIGAGVGYAYWALRSELLGSVDSQLTRQAQASASAERKGYFAQEHSKTAGKYPYTLGYLHRNFGDSVDYLQAVSATGVVTLPVGQKAKLPVSPAVEQVAQGKLPYAFQDISLDGQSVRMLTYSVGNGTAVQVALPLTDTDNELRQLGLELLLGAAAGILLAAGLGYWVTRTALRPVAGLTEAVELIAAEPRELDRRIELGPRGSRDELGRLAVSFNAMLGAVQDSTQRQRRLVADASHELRTPLTSLRTNAEVLAKFDRLGQADRDKVIASMLSGIDELTALVADTMELARGEEPEHAVMRVQWDDVVEEVIDRARLHWPDIEFVVELEACPVFGVSERLAKAARNLVNNAAKFSGGRGAVTIQLLPDQDSGQAVFTIRDQGPGIPAEDLPYVFDRFYRAEAMRDRPGSGLGLAIVAQVAESHGGSVTAANAEPGALFTLSIPLDRV